MKPSDESCSGSCYSEFEEGCDFCSRHGSPNPAISVSSELDAIAKELRALANEYAPKIGYLVMADKLNWIAATVRSAAPSGDREDSERLNFLENSRRGMEYLTCDDQDGEPTRHFWMVDDVLPDKYRVTLREAIDAARLHQEKPTND